MPTSDTTPDAEPTAPMSTSVHDTDTTSEPPRTVRVREGADGWGVATLVGKGNGFREKPCTRPDGTPTCPWVRDAPVGYFPPEVFVHSAETAYDTAEHMFGCHTSDRERPLTCAGFLLANADNNLTVRMYGPDPEEVSSDMELYDSYVEMAVANGVPPDHPALARCRANDEPGFIARDHLTPRGAE